MNIKNKNSKKISLSAFSWNNPKNDNRSDYFN
jgi:hypothetical protein